MPPQATYEVYAAEEATYDRDNTHDIVGNVSGASFVYADASHLRLYTCLTKYRDNNRFLVLAKEV